MNVTPTTAPDNLNVRAAAWGSVIDRAAPGEALEVLEAEDVARAKLGTLAPNNLWVNVRTPRGVRGFAAAWYLRESDAAPNDTPALPADYPTTQFAGAARALDFDHEPLFVRLPASEPARITSFGGFGPNNYSWATWQSGSDYYGNLCGLHNGVDFGLPVGSELCAADWGVVLHVSESVNDNPYAAGPFSVILRHGNHVALYGHVRGHKQDVDIFVEAGDVVAPGDLICASGTANGYAHLHFELRKISADYVRAMEFAGPAESAASLRWMNEQFGLRGWTPTGNYYVNPAQFFLTPPESYGWPNACSVSVDRDGNGYPDPYDLYSVAGIPAHGKHFWRDGWD